HTLEQLDDEEGGTVFRDVIMLALAGFVAIVLLLLPHLNPPGEAAKENTQPPGNVIVEVRWPDELDSDVDLWVEAPGDAPVGYSNKGGVIFNLLRDDLGKRADATGMNYEVSYSRGIPAGEYTVNVHLYRNTAGVFPIPVTVVTSVKKSTKESARQLLASHIELSREGEELTVYRFRLSEDGDLVPGSVHSLQRKLRTWRAS
ncbi:MAG TPA: hypothetical protein VE597_05965, partial [Geminicoccaceae bacterium]|nr:hypothetical protein [Geminicoccaceae bacterium]